MNLYTDHCKLLMIILWLTMNKNCFTSIIVDCSIQDAHCLEWVKMVDNVSQSNYSGWSWRRPNCSNSSVLLDARSNVLMSNVFFLTSLYQLLCKRYCLKCSVAEPQLWMIGLFFKKLIFEISSFGTPRAVTQVFVTGTLTLNTQATIVPCVCFPEICSCQQMRACTLGLITK